MTKVRGKGLKAVLRVFETRKQLAEAVGISQPAIARWGKGVPRARREAVIEAAAKLGFELTEQQLRGDL